MNLLKNLQKSALHLAFPTKCLHCSLILPPQPEVLCSSCSSLLELIDPEGRCPTCFNSIPENRTLCHNCLELPSEFDRMGAAFDDQGAAASLLKCFKYGNQPHLAKGMAAFLAVQFTQLDWPLPDALIPVPLSWTRWFERGYNQSDLLAQELGKYLNLPIWRPLKRKSGDFSQSSLTFEQRKGLKGSSFKLNSKHDLAGKNLLVIDDVMATGSTLRRCGELLNRAEPASLYALTFGCHFRDNKSLYEG